MPNQPSSKKPYIILVIIVVVAALLYFYFSGGQKNSSQTLDENTNVDIGSNVLNMLNQIGSLRIDKNFFADPAYQNLKDYTQTIPSQPVGRPNPFAPIPGMPLNLKPAK